MNLREAIKDAYQNFTVDGVHVPVSLLYYMGHGEPYVVYMQVDTDGVIAGDNEILGGIEYYDFDVYCKGNYDPICDRVKEINESLGFTWQPSRSSEDLFDPDTGYYHKTLNFAIERSYTNG